MTYPHPSPRPDSPLHNQKSVDVIVIEASGEPSGGAAGGGGALSLAWSEEPAWGRVQLPEVE